MTTYQELKAQAEELLRQAESLRKNERSAAISDVKAKIREWDISAAELGLGGALQKAGKTTPPGNRAVVAPKYRDNATGETWSGRGQHPKWLQGYINAGKTKEEFLIR